MTLPANPSDLQLLLHAHADGELDAATALALERRLSADPALDADYRRILALRRAIAAKLPPQPAPASLRARVAALAAPPPQQRERPSRREWTRLAAGVVIGAALASGGGYLLPGGRRPDPLVEALVSNHRRALLAASPVDVASSDRHTVRPWFESRLALSAPAIDLADKGFPLLGGRVDIVRGEPVATLAYRAGEHLVSLTALPDGGGSGDGALRRLSANGFNVWTWRDRGREYWVVSDVEPAELAAFVAAFRKADDGA